MPVLPLVDGGRNLFDLVHVRDVAELMLLAVRYDAAVGKAYNAGPSVPTSLRELVEAYRLAAGRLSRWLLARIVLGEEATLTDTGLALMSKDIHLAMSRARIDLGCEPRFRLEQGIAATLAGLDG